MSINQVTLYKSLDDDMELPIYDKIESLDNDITEDTSSYYNDKENIFFSLPPNNDTFLDKTYEEIQNISELLTIVLADVKNPPNFILNDFSFIEKGFHKRLIKYTPKNCNSILTDIILICQKETFDIYKTFLMKPKNIESINQILSNKDYFCSPINVYDLINIKKIVCDKIFDVEGDKILFANSDCNTRYNKRKFNFNNIRECINSDQYIMDRLESLQDGDYDREQTGITNNTYLFDERNSTFFNTYRKIKRLDEEKTPDFILRKIDEKEKRNSLYQNEYNNIKILLNNLQNTSRHGDDSLGHADKNLAKNITNRIFKSHKHYMYAFRDLKNLETYSDIDVNSIWCAIYASYVEECSSIQKVSEHTFRNYTDATDNFMFTDEDIELLNYINDKYRINRTHRRSKEQSLFIPLKRSGCVDFSTLPHDFNGVRKGYKINTLEEFRERFDIFTRGLFNNFDWLDGKCLISGSCVTACLAHYNKCGDDIKQFEGYIDANYKKSDVDMCTNPELLPQLQQNIYKLYKNQELSKKTKKLRFFKKTMTPTTVTLCANITKFVTNLDELTDFTKVSEKNVISYKCNCCSFKQKPELFMKGETHFILCERVSKLLQESNRNGASIYKLSIDPPNDTNYFRSIDVYSNNLGKIGLYHMPIVRAAYSGTKIYMYPSFVCTALSGYCPDYKWFKGRKNPMSIILDKWMKGYNIILNSTEQTQLMAYFIYNYSNEAKTKTPELAPYRDNWDYTFSDPRNIKRIGSRISTHAHAMETSPKLDDRHLKQIILDNLLK